MHKSNNRFRSGFLPLLLIGVGSIYPHRAFRTEKRQKCETLRVAND